MQLQLLRQVLLTVSYSLVFSKPLSESEISLRLICSDRSKKDDDSIKISSTISSLQQFKILKKSGEYWQLSKTGKDLSLSRKKRERLSILKIKELQPLINFAKSIDWITGVAITGSVSVQNAEAKDDVDLMIIVRAGRLWLVRPLLVLFSFLHGKRRSWKHEEYNSWCLNLWLEEDSLAVHPDKRSVYTAYEVCQADWLLNKNNAEQTFLKANAWTQHYLPQYFSHKLQKSQQVTKKPRGDSFFDEFWNLCNDQAYSLQRWYMNRHMTTERVGKSFAFFHPRDTRRNIFQAWKEVILSIT